MFEPTFGYDDPDYVTHEEFERYRLSLAAPKPPEEVASDILMSVGLDILGEIKHVGLYASIISYASNVNTIMTELEFLYGKWEASLLRHVPLFSDLAELKTLYEGRYANVRSDYIGAMARYDPSNSKQHDAIVQLNNSYVEMAIELNKEYQREYGALTEQIKNNFGGLLHDFINVTLGVHLYKYFIAVQIDNPRFNDYYDRYQKEYDVATNASERLAARGALIDRVKGLEADIQEVWNTYFKEMIPKEPMYQKLYNLTYEEFSQYTSFAQIPPLGIPLIEGGGDIPPFRKAYTSPVIVLDLDGNGILETTTLKDGVYFDHNGVGTAEKTAWIGRGDAILVRDLDGDGEIRTGAEMFGNNTKLKNGKTSLTGFDILAELAGSDEKIDSSDVAWKELLLWQDKNGDGVVDSGELLTLDEAGIEYIETGYTAQTGLRDENNNVHYAFGRFKFKDSTTMDEMRTVFLDTDGTNTLAQPAGGHLPNEITELPNIQQWGDMPSLHKAMSLDSSGELIELVNRFVATADASERALIIDDILLQWLKTSDVKKKFGIRTEDKEDFYFKAQVVGAFAGLHYDQFALVDGGYSDASGTYSAYQDISRYVQAKLEQQSHYAGMYQTAWYSYQTYTAGPYQEHIREFADMLKAQFDAGHGGEVFGFMESLLYSGFSWGKDILRNMLLVADSYLNEHRDVKTLEDFYYCVREYFRGDLEGICKEVHDSDDSTNVESWRHADVHTQYITKPKENLRVFPDQATVIEAKVGKAGKIYGREGMDIVFGYNGANTIHGEGGSDVIYAGDGEDEVYGGDGDDYIMGEGGDDTIYGGMGDDYIFGDLGFGFMFEFDPNNTASYFNSGTYTFGYRGDTNSDNLPGDDYLYGGAGNDRIHGGDGRDHIDGGTGNDIIYGGDGDDTIFGGLGDDVIYGNNGTDKIYGGEGKDTLYGGAGADHLYGGEGIDFLYGDSGDDHLYGGQEIDYMYGGENNDWLYGEEENDQLYGEKGDDHLIGGAGNDVLDDLEGNNTFHWGKGDGHDIIRWRHVEQKNYNNTLDLGGLTFTDVSFSREYSHLVVKNRLTGETIRIENAFGGLNQAVNQFKFADNTIKTMDEILRSHVYSSTALRSTSSDEEIDLAGDSRTFAWGSGDGNDSVRISDSGDMKNNVVQLLDMNREDVEFRASVGSRYYDPVTWEENYKSNLLVINKKTGEVLTIRDFFGQSNEENDRSLQRLEFADGSAMTYNEILNCGVRLDEDMTKFSAPKEGVTVIGNDRDNRLIGSQEADVLSGEKGDDSLSGGGGDDVYLFNRGDGHDRISEVYVHESGWEWLSGSDTLVFGEGINPEDLLFTASGEDDLIVSIVGSDDSVKIHNGLKNKWLMRGVEFFQAGGRRLELQNTYVIMEYINSLAELGAPAGEGGLWSVSQRERLASIIQRTWVTAEARGATIKGTSGAEQLTGTDAGEAIDGKGGNDVFYGAGGDDKISGRGGDDIYLFRRGDGADHISDESGNDTIAFIDDVVVQDLHFSMVDDDLVISLVGSGDRVTVWFFSSPYHQIERIVVDNKVLSVDDIKRWVDFHASLGAPAGVDGTWSQSQKDRIAAKATEDWRPYDAFSNSIFGGIANDRLNGVDSGEVIYGLGGNDTLSGGRGNDHLIGGSGDDVFVYGKGYGNDTVDAHDTIIGKRDGLRLIGLGRSDVDFMRDGGHFVVKIRETGETITVLNGMQGNRDGIQYVQFGDGSITNFGDINLTETTGTGSADTLHGGFYDDAIQGFGGNDTIYGGAGDDELDGGAGDDILTGGSGNDTYIFGRGYGHDIIDAYDMALEKKGLIRFLRGWSRPEGSRSLPSHQSQFDFV